MNIFLIIVIVVLAIVIAIQFAYRQRLAKVSSHLISTALIANVELEEKLDARNKQYTALEQGTQEIIDNYENDLLDMKARNEAAYNSAAYDREMRDKAEKLMELQNTVIEKHAEGCESILQEIADAIVADILPPKEEAGG